MPWTAEKERRYQELLRIREERAAQRRLEAAQSQRRPRSETEEAEQEFSLTRMLGGGAQDALNAIVDTANWFSSPERLLPGATNAVASRASPFALFPVANLISGQIQSSLGAEEPRLQAKKLDVVEDSEGTVESIGRSITSFIIPYTAAARAVRVGQGASFMNNVAREVTAVSLVSMAAMDAETNNMANALRDAFGLEWAVLDALATEEDDDLLEGRVKATIANLPVELVGTAAIDAAVAGVRAFREMRKINQEQRDMIDVTKETLTVKATASMGVKKKAAKETATASAGGAAPAGSTAGATPLDQASEFSIKPEDLLTAPKAPKKGEEMVSVPKSSVEPREIKTLDQLSKYISDLVDGIPVGQEAALEKIANALIKNPHDALGKLDIDPVKLDHSVLDSPEKIIALQDSLADLVHKVARRTGRAQEVVSNKQALRTARLLTSSPKAIWELTRRAKHLPEHMLAARMIVGSNGHRLAATAELAAKEIEAGNGPGEAYKEFVRSLGQHGLLLGTLRGAASEIARALQTQQVVLGITGDEIAERLTKEAAEDAEDPFVKAYEELFNDLTTDAGRLRLLNRVKEANGDLSELTKVVRSRQKSLLDWADNALSETKGNLFSFGTSLYNLGSAGIMMSFNAANHLLAGAGLGVGALLRGSPEMGTAARKQLYKGWASVNAPILAGGKAFKAAFDVLAKEGLDEVAVLADSFGFEKLAATAMRSSNEFGGRVERGWLKKDMRVGEKAIYVSPEAVRKTIDKYGNWPIGKVGQVGLEWFIKSQAAAVNTFGAGTRLALTTFISAPDAFAGTLAAQIGKSVKAVDIAAQEGADAGLTGKALNDYISARARDLEDVVAGGTGPDAYDNAAKGVMEAAGNDYARKINFADDLETSALRSASSMFENIPILGTLIMPFPKTPLRVMETTIIDFTPLGLLKARVRDMLTSGDPEQVGEVMARMAMSTAMLAGAWELAGSQILVGHDGGFSNTARRVRDSYTLKIGDDYHDISRLDPIGTILGFMADARSVMENGADNRAFQGASADYIGELGSDIFEAILWPTFKNVFNKAYLESLSTLMDVNSARTPEQASQVIERYIASSATRLVPGSGFQRQTEKLDDGEVKAARTLVDGWLKASWGSDKLPPRLDPIFGRPLQYSAGERLIGWKGGPSQANAIDRELARLSFEMQPMDRKQNGVKLNQTQYNRLLQLRGHELKLGGKSLEERITETVESPLWDNWSDPRKIEFVKETTSKYTSAAKRAFLKEDKKFRYETFVIERREQLEFNGMEPVLADTEAKRLAEQLGLAPQP